MANYRNEVSVFQVGAVPPDILWTVVKGDTAAFRVYVTDQDCYPLDISEWTINMDIVRPPEDTIIVSLTPGPTEGDGPGEFTVSLTSSESDLLLTGDEFDIQMSKVGIVWTIAKGFMTIYGDITE